LGTVFDIGQEWEEAYASHHSGILEVLSHISLIENVSDLNHSVDSSYPIYFFRREVCLEANLSNAIISLVLLVPQIIDL
jgi:hypothetical protein